MVRSETHKLLHYAVDDRTELYDLTSDPDEQHDLLATGDADPVVLGPLTARLQELMGADRRARHRPDAAPITPDLVEELRALGYLVPEDDTSR
jgi:hypothetical protein